MTAKYFWNKANTCWTVRSVMVLDRKFCNLKMVRSVVSGLHIFIIVMMKSRTPVTHIHESNKNSPSVHFYNVRHDQGVFPKKTRLNYFDSVLELDVSERICKMLEGVVQKCFWRIHPRLQQFLHDFLPISRILIPNLSSAYMTSLEIDSPRNFILFRKQLNKTSIFTPFHLTAGVKPCL